MTPIKGTKTASGVFVADEFRDNLIIDRYDPIFIGMRASKLKHMRSANSEDVVTWNVFRSLRQIDPSLWTDRLLKVAVGVQRPNALQLTTVEVWKPVPPPPSLLQDGDEGISEIDIVVEHPDWVFFIEAKLKSDISIGTTTRPERDQLLRNIDVGSYYAGVREFFFALLISDETQSPKGVELIREHGNQERLKTLLPHRVDGLVNLHGVGLLKWSDLGDILMDIEAKSTREPERDCARRCVSWLEHRLPKWDRQSGEQQSPVKRD